MSYIIKMTASFKISRFTVAGIHRKRTMEVAPVICSRAPAGMTKKIFQTPPPNLL